MFFSFLLRNICLFRVVTLMTRSHVNNNDSVTGKQQVVVLVGRKEQLHGGHVRPCMCQKTNFELA
jgi:hypothetical protein